MFSVAATCRRTSRARPSRLGAIIIGLSMLVAGAAQARTP